MASSVKQGNELVAKRWALALMELALEDENISKEDILDDIEQSLEEANRELDKMYGSNRIKAMKTVNKLLEDQITNLNRRADENAQWAQYDQQMLERSLDNSEFNKIGLEFNIDAESGNITNYSEVMGSLY